MNKRYLFIGAFVFNICLINAQTFFSEKEENLIYYSTAIAPTAVCVSDINGDGDQDILSFFDKKFRLYLHSGATGIFNEQKIISDTVDWILSVHISDLNKDGKQDILAASYNKDKIIWYENEGDNTFGSPITITDSARGASSVYAADLDNDDDQDVLSASLWDNKIAWYENMGGGNFSEQKVITVLAEGARYVYVSDLNGDGLTDVISASLYDNKIAWYENKGGDIFGEQKVITDAVARALCVYAADLNGDGHQDILSASAWDNKIAWYKNDGQGNFDTQHVISDALKSAQSVYASDLDGDGDKDVLSASLLDNKIAWFENNGAGDFGSQQVVTSSADGPGFVYAGDIDGDGYNDIVSASTDFKIAWYENTLPLKILTNPEDTAVFPNNNAGFKIIADNTTGYQWQSNDGEGFFDLTDNNVYAGVNTGTLEITGVTFDMHGNKFRCVAINGEDSLYSAIATLTVVDTINPVITSVHPDTILPANAWCIAEIPDFTGHVEASDNSNSILAYTQIPVPWTKMFKDAEEITLIATDYAGNSSQVKFNILVIDQTPPVFTVLPENKELKINGDGQFVLPDYSYSIEVTDNCSHYSAIHITQEPAPNYVLPDTVFEISVTFTATDEAGNSSQVSYKFNTTDQIPPVITSAHPDVTLEVNHLCLAYLPDFTGEVEATDNFDEFSELIITQTPDANTSISGKDNPVTLTAEDKAGNITEVTFNVEVSNPVIITCIEDKILNLEEGKTTYTVSGYEFDPVYLELICGFGNLTNNINSSLTLDQVTFSSDTTNVVWTLSDKAGNIAQCSFNVILNKLIGIETMLQYGISVYPNPTTGDIFIESPAPLQRLRIMDLKGSIIMEKTDMPKKGRINMDAFKSGTYILNIITDTGVHNIKILKE